MKSSSPVRKFWITFFCLMAGTIYNIQAQKPEDQSINLAAGETFQLNNDWIQYASTKVLKKVSSYPFVENKNLKGLVGTLNTEVKFYNMKKEGNLEQWFAKQCKQLVNLYPKDHSRIRMEKNNSVCIVEISPTEEEKGMIQYMKAKSIKTHGNDNQVFVYTYNFYTPLKSAMKPKNSWAKMKAAVEYLMNANLKG